MKDIEVRQMRYFIAVAENLHFGRAAASLHISQSALSQQITNLEEHLGTTLLKRDRRNVQLTEAGSVLHSRFKEILDQLNQTQTILSELKEKPTEQIALGLVERTHLHFLITAEGALRKLYPKIKFKLHEMNVILQIPALLTHEIDVSIGILPPGVTQIKNISYQPLITTDWGLLIPKHHRLAKKKAIHLKDLTREHLITFPHSMNPQFYAWMMKLFQKANVHPAMINETTETDFGIRMVEEGGGVLLSPSYLIQDTYPNAVRIPVIDIPMITLVVFWRKNESSGLILDFIELLEEAAKNEIPPRIPHQNKKPTDHKSAGFNTSTSQ